MQARKKYFDENVPDDVQAVLDVSALLGIPEFRLFDIAYRFWYGEGADEKTIERYFIPYMFQDVVPLWVRHFTHHVRSLGRQGRLDKTAFGIQRRVATSESVQRGRVYALTLLTVLVVLLLLAELAADQFCLFPPCY
ncbi:MAG: hypothetical protein ACE5H8_10715 [Alphaproteobacteria bacterium]